MTAERTKNDARPGASGRASHQLKTPQGLGGSTLVNDTVAPTPESEMGGFKRSAQHLL